MVSNWWLYIGIFMCCTGFGLPAGIIFIFVWAFKQLQDKGITVNYNDKKTDNIEEEITSKANWHQYT
jgi:protein-S-isoprenylcysteine O-methyltransferase Ste14